ncbi:hypothetical protein BC938DRAFT_482324 [Jimgerdemannia flammicorona]|uniref:Uncharacterized protein n=1 Tax=Jimgerdemannia flammicorona TaxID=994334 RepID=A0A433QWJ8_9FUNG|nr:hypothetical protein BC938DRAFT_482324 [Jimgerdemannia flammicorona]
MGKYPSEPPSNPAGDSHSIALVTTHAPIRGKRSSSTFRFSSLSSNRESLPSEQAQFLAVFSVGYGAKKRSEF